MPPERSFGIMSRAPRRPTACSFMSTTRRTISSGGLKFSRIGNAMLSYTVRSLKSPLDWNIIPISRRSL